MFLGSTAAMRLQSTKGELNRTADSIHLTADRVVPPDLTFSSSREILLGPTGAAFALKGIIVATDSLLKKSGTAVFGPP